MMDRVSQEKRKNAQEEETRHSKAQKKRKRVALSEKLNVSIE